MHSNHLLATLDSSLCRATISHLPPHSCIGQPITAILTLQTESSSPVLQGSIFLLDSAQNLQIVVTTPSHHPHHLRLHHNPETYALYKHHSKLNNHPIATATISKRGLCLITMGTRVFRLQSRKNGQIALLQGLREQNKPLARVVYEEARSWSLDFDDRVPECLLAFCFWLQLALNRRTER